ncbi:hypothetical protein G6F57_010283 [Rhizopus arrhizus]|nr:hypothetical protein G6F23_012595 [Rhizopus arrhizus]KAG1393203.1 hypothetical protein G6F58_012357 [Rhizopus delemar]KAG0757823.1 hypothetical protein G6F24_010223 [Rhizopus arrhizus]KAG0783969.1 hypothetical protein G6F21_010203 [Rhizopus arrhizus]KAG0794202.1 hypothetical protein G6F22_005413 [Rhizopus arrhizus]
MTERDDKVYMAKIAEQAERYDEMVTFVKEAIQINGSLSTEERNLLSTSFKNVVGAHRNSLRIIYSVLAREKEKENEAQVNIVERYKDKIEQELYAICDDLLNLLNERLVPVAKEAEEKVFCYKMLGDYHRYIAEYATGEKRLQSADSAHEAYQQAMTIAEKDLDTVNPVRLGLALNYSVFYYEILNSPDRACQLAKEAFDDAITELDNMTDHSYKDSVLIMQLLRDNVSLWSAETQQDIQE